MRKVVRCFRNENGVGLMEVMIAVGVMSVVTMGTMTLINEMHKGQTGMAFRQRADDFAGEVKLVLRDEASCTQTLGGKTLVADDDSWSEDISSIKQVDKFGTVTDAYTPGYEPGDRFFNLNSMKLENYDSTKKTAEVHLKVHTDKGLTGPSSVTRPIKISVEDNGADELLSCHAIGGVDENDSYWVANLDDIYYDEGRVGVGTDTPTAPLDVFGEDRQITARSSGGAGWIDISSSAGGIGMLASNSYIGSGNNIRYSNDHGSIGASGITLNRPAWGDVAFFSNLGATTAGAAHTPSYKMVIKNSGFVGIGTETPTEQLEINGNGNLLFRATASDPGDIIFQESSSVQKARIWSGPGAGAAGQQLHLSTGDNVPDLTVTDTGTVNTGGALSVGTNLGVGVAPSAYRMDVNGDTYLRGRVGIGKVPNGAYSVDIQGNLRTIGGANLGNGTIVIPDSGNSITVGTGSGRGRIDIIGSTVDNAALRLLDGLNRVRGNFIYDDDMNRLEIRAWNSDTRSRIRMQNGTNHIQGDGNFQDAAFGPSEWVLGEGRQGEVVCFVGSREDDDGEWRSIVEPCSEENSSLVAGVIIPDDDEAHHGNPNFDYKDKISKKFKFKNNEFMDKFWRKNHVGLELTGFRFIHAIGPVELGDALVSSSMPGHVKGTKSPGPQAIVGTALQTLKAGEKGRVFARIHLRSGLPEPLYRLNELASEDRPDAFDSTIMNFVNNLRELMGLDSEIKSLKAENQELKREVSSLKSWACRQDPKAPFCE